MGRYTDIKREEELKNKVEQDFFGRFDCTEIIGNVDFAVKVKRPPNTLYLFDSDDYLLWAEAKNKPADITEMLAQLVLTIGKARPFDRDKILPPPYLGCFDCEKIAFIPYHEIQDIFSKNDFNWNVTSSRRETKEFRQICELVNKIGGGKKFIFYFDKNETELKTFIKENFDLNRHPTRKTQINKNNFTIVYYKWLETVKPTIEINWESAKKSGILDGYFYLADLLSHENQTLKEKLFVLLNKNRYEANRHIDTVGMLNYSTAEFKDGQNAHTRFWAIYERPPKEEYWDYIVDRIDLLVPQDVRERKGSFYTPRQWVELSQKYIADVLGENWQSEYYVWDCAAGTGNLLAGLTNKYNIWASTLDKADVDIMHDRIKSGANLLEEHCFQFDFLNEPFDGLPEGLLDIIKNTPEKLIVYINPPYAEAMSRIDATKAKIDVNRTVTEKTYVDIAGKSIRELFIQFLIRIYKEIPGSIIANFSKLKHLQSPNFENFRDAFNPKLKKIFLVPAYTFDNVKGKFPIGFHIWDTKKKERFKKAVADLYDETGNNIGKKTIYCYDKNSTMNDWLKQFVDTETQKEMYVMCCIGNDFQHQNYINISHRSRLKGVGNAKGIAKFRITQNNIIPASIYLAVRHCVKPTWLNDRDQFLYPNDDWQTDKIFQSDCLAYTLFHNSNNISSKHGVNYWIPFTESEVNARNKFKSSFMTDFIAGKLKQPPKAVEQIDAFHEKQARRKTPLTFSAEARAVFDAGKKLWAYYHSKPKVNVNASFYDIREYFQGRSEKGKMNNKSGDAKYTELIENLRERLKTLAKKIEPKIYEYGFLRE